MYTYPPPPFTRLPPSKKKKKKKKEKRKKKKKRKKKFFFCQIRIPCQFIEKYSPLPPKNKLNSLSKIFAYHYPPLSPFAQTTPPTPPNFFLIWIICQLDSVLVNFFYKLTKNPNLKKSFLLLLFFFFAGGGGGCDGRGSEHNVQMFQMALLLFKKYNCAKLF